MVDKTVFAITSVFLKIPTVDFVPGIYVVWNLSEVDHMTQNVKLGAKRRKQVLYF